MTRLALPLLLLAGCTAPVAEPLMVEPPAAPAADAPSSGRAVVSAADPRAAAAGVALLEAGGNALDASLATLLALTVVEPQSSGIGGGGFLVYQPAGGTRPTTYDGREEAPAAATPTRFVVDGKPMPYTVARSGGHAVGVPGNIAMMARAHAAHGKAPWKSLFVPAIALARDGFTVTPRFAASIENHRALLAASPEAMTLYFQSDGSPKPVGATVRNPRLAALLERVAAQGADGFYKGTAAANLAAAVTAAPVNPAPLTQRDLDAYRAVERAPVCGKYRTFTICGMGPPSSGGIAVYAILKQVERFDLARLGKDSPEAWHVIGESMRLAYADRAQWIGDPDHVAVPTAGLVSDAYLRDRSALISAARAMAKAPPGRPAGAPTLASAPDPEVAGTSHFAVADAAGNVASLTSTVEAGFGSGLVVDGYVLNNELTDFDRGPAAAGAPTANRVGPGKRPRSSMAPTIVYDARGRAVAAIGAAGGPTIIAQVAKALIGVLDWKLPVQEAIALPQLMGMGDRLIVEADTPLAGLADALRAKGHNVTVTPFGGKLNGVERTPTGWRGGADPRSEGRALGL